MKTPKILAFLLSLVLILALFSACGSPSNGGEGSSDQSGAPSSPDGETSGGTTDPDNLTIVENGTSQYRVIVNETYVSTLEACAGKLIESIAEKTGATLSATTDLEHHLIKDSAATDYEILVGTARDGKYFDTSVLPSLTDLDFHITVVGTRVLILGGSPAAVIRGVDYFIQNCLPSENTGTWKLPVSTDHLEIADRSGTMTVMSLNLLHGYTSYASKVIYGTETPVNEMDNTVDKRKERVRELLLTYLPDVIGMQEVSNWHSFLESDSALTGAGYKLLRCQKGQKISIYYNSNKLTTLDTGSIYLTEDPENLECSIEWKSDGNPRLAHFVRFRINATGETFVAVNTHIGFENATLQTNQTRVVGEYCEQLADKYGDPVICTGDFNSAYGSVHYKTYVDLGLMDDTRFLATESSEGSGSFNGFGSASLANYAIDQVMVSKEDWTVYTYKVDYTMFGKHLYYSDHYAVVATMILTPKSE